MVQQFNGEAKKTSSVMASNCQYLWFSSSSDAKCHKDHVPEKGNNMVKVYCRNVFTDVAIAVTQ